MFNFLIDFNNRVHNSVHDELSASESDDHETIQSIMAKAEENNQHIKTIIETNTRQAEKVSENIDEDLPAILELADRFRAGSTPRPVKKNQENRASLHPDSQMDSPPHMRAVSRPVPSVAPVKEERSALLDITGSLIESKVNSILKSVENIDSHLDTILNKTEKKLENLDSQVDAFFNMSDEQIEAKVDNFIDNTEKSIEKTAHSILDDLEKKFEKQLAKSEEELVDQLEKALDATTGAERMALSKEIKLRYGQGTLSKTLLRMGKGGYEVGRKLGVLKRNEEFEATLELAEEFNEARQTVLDEVTSFIEQPAKTVHEKFKKWFRE